MTTPGAVVLIVEDDDATRRSVSANLVAHGFRVVEAGDVRSAMRSLESVRPDLILLDLGLPDDDGLVVIRRVRRDATTPILVLSARDAEPDKVTALESGADDYLTKPFGAGELMARIRVALRHAERRQVTLAQIAIGDLRIDLARRRVSCGGEDVRLTPTEYALLTALATQAGRVLTHSWLLEQIWGAGYEGNVQNLHVFISQLRRKIEPAPARPRYILTEPGIGYRFADPEER